MDDIKFLMGAEASLSTTSVTPGQVYFTRDTTNGISKIYLDINANRLNVVPAQIDSHAWGTPIKFKRVTYNYPVNLEVGEIAFNTVNKSLWLGNGSDAPSLLITPNYILSEHSWDSTTDSTVGPKLTLKQKDAITESELVFNLDPIPAANESSSGIITTGEQIFTGQKTFQKTVLSSTIYPRSNNTYNLGTSDYGYKNIYQNTNTDNGGGIWIFGNGVSYGKMRANIIGTISTIGYSRLSLGNEIPFGTENNARGELALYGSETAYISLRSETKNNRIITFRDPGQPSAYVITATIKDAIGSESNPVYADENGVIQPITSYEGNSASASKLTNTTVIGSNTQPVYFTEEGIPAAVTAVDLSYGGTGSNLSTGTANAIITMGSSTGGAMVAKATSAGAVYVSSTNGAITFGNLPLTYGGTGANLSTASTNSIIYKTTTGLAGKATSIGAAYVTSAGGILTFGTLPIAQGGTGATSASAALTALGAAPISHASSNTTYGVGSTSNYGHVKITSGNGLSISSGTITMSAASSSAAGAITIGTQTFAGQKTFSDTLITNSDLDANGRILLSTNCYGTSFPTSNNVEGRIFFLKM